MKDNFKLLSDEYFPNPKIIHQAVKENIKDIRCLVGYPKEIEESKVYFMKNSESFYQDKYHKIPL